MNFDDEEDLCGVGIATIPKKISDALALTDSCEMHDNYYEYARMTFLQVTKEVTSKEELVRLAEEKGFKRRIKWADSQFKYWMKVEAQRAGIYWFTWPLVKAFGKIIDVFGYRFWLYRTIKVWESSR